MNGTITAISHIYHLCPFTKVCFLFFKLIQILLDLLPTLSSPSSSPPLFLFPVAISITVHLNLATISSIALNFALNFAFFLSSCSNSFCSSSNFLFLFCRCLLHASACSLSLLSSRVSSLVSVMLDTSGGGEGGEGGGIEDEEETAEEGREL